MRNKPLYVKSLRFRFCVLGQLLLTLPMNAANFSMQLRNSLMAQRGIRVSRAVSHQVLLTELQGATGATFFALGVSKRKVNLSSQTPLRQQSPKCSGSRLPVNVLMMPWNRNSAFRLKETLSPAHLPCFEVQTRQSEACAGPPAEPRQGRFPSQAYRRVSVHARG